MSAVFNVIGELARQAFSLHQLWLPKQAPWLAILMALPATQVILMFAQKGFADRFWNNYAAVFTRRSST
jgi:hypothetical protein